MAWASSPTTLHVADLSLLADPAELALLREMASFPRVLEGAASHFEPHRVAFYLQDLAGAFHALVDTRQGGAELALPARRRRPSSRGRGWRCCAAVRGVLATGLGLMGVRPVEEMH